MKVLVTGGAGYVGCLLVPQLLERGYKVRVLDNLMYGGNGLLPCCLDPNFEFIKGDVRDPEVVRDAVCDADVIIHLAAIVGYPACKKDPQLAEEVNLGGTVNLGGAGRGTGRRTVAPACALRTVAPRLMRALNLGASVAIYPSFPVRPFRSTRKFSSSPGANTMRSKRVTLSPVNLRSHTAPQ